MDMINSVPAEANNLRMIYLIMGALTQFGYEI